MYDVCVYMMYMQAFVNLYMCATNAAEVRGQPWSFFTLIFQLFCDKGLFVVHHCVCQTHWCANSQGFSLCPPTIVP